MRTHQFTLTDADVVVNFQFEDCPEDADTFFLEVYGENHDEDNMLLVDVDDANKLADFLTDFVIKARNLQNAKKKE